MADEQQHRDEHGDGQLREPLSYIDELSESSSNQQPNFGHEEDIVQVVYQSNQDGALVGVGLTLLPASYATAEQPQQYAESEMLAYSQQQQQPRAVSALPSVAEESSGIQNLGVEFVASAESSPVEQQQQYGDYEAPTDESPQYYAGDGQPDAIYSRVNKSQRPAESPEPSYSPASFGFSGGQQLAEQSAGKHPLIGERINEEDELAETVISAEVHRAPDLLARPKGVAESGSFRHNFRKKLGVSVSSNENDLTAHRQKFLQAQEGRGGQQPADAIDACESNQEAAKLRRNHSVSFNVGAARANRHSIDIRNLPSYLTVKRASIVEVAKGAMSSLIHSLSTSSAGQRRDSSPEDEEPIFEEAIAPTLSLGQRVALVRNNGSEFGTVGWIGQLPEVEDDWIVGVIFDNMIGNCDGAYNGQRYFYARDNYAMFVPLAALTKTDNYIGRPETGTMLSRMSVSLKPGQLISIQRSSIRLQHCFLNAPHQRVGHDVRAVSNRLHCQCHNCGPCAHLTKQSRINAVPHFGAHHIGASAHQKKNSLAHAAVEILTHHHHHFHEDEAHEEEDYQFGDNAAHACNFVRYSCCQQSGSAGHEFSSDCGLVRPELLDNLIHAPKAPHRRSRPRRRRQRPQPQPLEAPPLDQKLAIESNQSTLAEGETGTLVSSNYTAGTLTTSATRTDEDDERQSDESSTSSESRSSSEERQPLEPQADGYQQQSACGYPVGTITSSYLYDQSSSTYQQNLNLYNTIDSQVSYMDQQRFVQQRDSSAIIHSPHSQLSNDSYERRGLVHRIRRCLTCLLGRDRNQRAGRRGRRKRRKTSLKDRMVEYRRKQSTFVPSTLAKPQEDFASHGIIMPPPGAPFGGPGEFAGNSDYSSQYSRSSGRSSRASSRSSSPGNQGGAAMAAQRYHGDFLVQSQPEQQHQLKSSRPADGSVGFATIDYTDYTFSERYGEMSAKDDDQDSKLRRSSTDLGFCDTCGTNRSNDTLKSLVDKSINDEVSPLEPLVLENFEGHAAEQSGEVYISPLSSAEHEQRGVEVSSPTATTVSLAESERDLDRVEDTMDRLDLGSEREE